MREVLTFIVLKIHMGKWKCEGHTQARLQSEEEKNQHYKCIFALPIPWLLPIYVFFFSIIYNDDVKMFPMKVERRKMSY